MTQRARASRFLVFSEKRKKLREPIRRKKELREPIRRKKELPAGGGRRARGGAVDSLPSAMWELVQHRGNLLQLVGLQQAPRDDRTICGDDWMRLQDVKWLRSDATGEAVPVIGTLTRFLRDVASLRSDMPIKSAGTLGKLLNGTYKSHGQPVLTITKNHWRAVQLSADEARHRPPLCARPRSLGARPAAPRGAPHSRSNILCMCAETAQQGRRKAA